MQSEEGKNMAKKIFDEAMIATWKREMADNRPEGFSDEDLAGLKQVDSFAPGALTAGFSMRMALRNGGTIDVVMNPVVARHLAACILTMGQQAGWLDEGGNVISPDLRFDG